MTRFGGTTAVAGALLGLVLACAACAPPDGTGVPGLAPAEAGPLAEPGGPPQDPVAPAGYVPVRRDGQREGRRLPGTAGALSPLGKVSYPDGVALRVDLSARRVEKAKGPGAFPGRGLTAATISLSNRSEQVLDLTRVVVTTTYGDPARIAAPVYEDAGLADFAGSLQPAKTATARYAFAIPAGAGPVAIVVDWDQLHAPAVFEGAVR